MRSMKPVGARAFRPGFTLIELLVVLVLIGLAFTIVTPALITPRPATESAMQRVVDGARRLALRRAGELLLTFDAEGAWRIEEAGVLDGVGLRSGELGEAPQQPLRLRISALGACKLVSPDPRQRAVDLIRCRVIE